MIFIWRITLKQGTGFGTVGISSEVEYFRDHVSCISVDRLEDDLLTDEIKHDNCVFIIEQSYVAFPYLKINNLTRFEPTDLKYSLFASNRATSVGTQIYEQYIRLLLRWWAATALGKYNQWVTVISNLNVWKCYLRRGKICLKIYRAMERQRLSLSGLNKLLAIKDLNRLLAQNEEILHSTHREVSDRLIVPELVLAQDTQDLFVLVNQKCEISLILLQKANQRLGCSRATFVLLLAVRLECFDALWLYVDW